MEKEKRKNIIIGFLIVIILVMGVLIGLLVTGKINFDNDYDNNGESNNSELTDNENQDVISDGESGELNSNSNVYNESDFIRQTSITLVEEPECHSFDENASLVATIENNGNISIASNGGAAMISPGNAKYLYHVEKFACDIVSLYYITNDNSLYVLDNPRSDIDQTATKVTDQKVIEFLGTESKGNIRYLKVLLENNEVEYVEYLKTLS